MSPPEPLVLGHVEDHTSPSFWNAPFIIRVNLCNKAVDAALDTGASLSAVHANMISDVLQHSQKVQPWTLPPIQLANSAYCSPTGIVWLNIGLKGQRVYHRYVIIPYLSSPFILGMDFMLRASVRIHIPSRTVTLGEPTPQEVLSEWVDAPEIESLMFLNVSQSALDEKVELACLEREQKGKLLDLQDLFSLFDGHLGHTSLAEHVINTGDATPAHLPPYRMSTAKKNRSSRTRFRWC